MNWDVVAGDWTRFKGRVRARWIKLTDPHLDLIAGRREALAGQLRETYGLTGREAETQIKGFEKRNKDYGSGMSEPGASLRQ